MPLLKTFCYAVRDIPRVYAKFGFCTADDLAAADSHLRSRYGTAYQFVEILQLVPVSVRGRAAEKEVMRVLAQYHTAREFLTFPDEATMRAQLETTFAALACEEAAAFLVERCRESRADRLARRLARETARTAATAATVATLKRKAELTELREKEKQARLDTAIAKKTHQLPPELDVFRVWADEHLKIGSGNDFITRKELERAVRSADVPIRPMQLKKRVLAIYQPRGVVLKRDHFVGGVKYTSVWLNLRLSP